MAVEQQTDVSRLWSSIRTTTAFGQRLTISNRTVSHLSFYLRRLGSVTGSVKFWIRKVSDDSVIVSKNWGLGSSIGTTPAWYEVEWDTPAFIDEEVYLLVGEGNISNSAGNLINVYDSNGVDVKADEYMVRRASSVYTNYTGQDFGYKYTYTIGAAGFIYSQAYIIA